MQPDLPPSFFATYFFTVLLLNIVPLFVQSAVCVTADGAYRGETISLGAAYRQSLRRFWHQLAASLIFGFALVGSIYAIFFLLFAVGFAGVLLHLTGPIAIVGIVILSIVGLAIFLALLAWGYVIYALAALSIALGRNCFINALVLSFKTVFSVCESLAPHFGAGFIVVAVFLVAELIAAGIVGLFAFLIMIPQLAIALPGVVVILATCFLTTYIVAFAYDLKVRGQGFDLELEMAATDIVAPA